MTTICFTRTFSAAHRLLHDDSKCHNIHGHNYEVEVEIAAEVDEKSGFIVSFDEVKVVVDNFDHSIILHDADPLVDILYNHGLKVRVVRNEPTTENLAQMISDAVYQIVPDTNAVVAVTLYETDSIQATAVTP